MGLSFERSLLAFSGSDYIASDTAFSICEGVALTIAVKANREHHYFTLGEAAFNDKAFSDNKAGLEKAKRLFGDNWKQTRYHNLVRLGGDILRSPLGEFPKATILGGLLEWAKHHPLDSP